MMLKRKVETKGKVGQIYMFDDNATELISAAINIYENPGHWHHRICCCIATRYIPQIQTFVRAHARLVGDERRFGDISGIMHVACREK